MTVTSIRSFVCLSVCDSLCMSKSMHVYYLLVRSTTCEICIVNTTGCNSYVIRIWNTFSLISIVLLLMILCWLWSAFETLCNITPIYIFKVLRSPRVYGPILVHDDNWFLLKVQQLLRKKWFFFHMHSEWNGSYDRSKKMYTSLI